MRIIKDETTAVIIDVQERLQPHMQNSDALTHNIITLVQGLKILGVPTLLTQQYTKGLGPTIEPLAQELGAVSAIEKVCFSCCDEPVFIQALEKLGRRFIIVAGIEAHICVLQTVLDLVSAGYTPIVVENCLSSRKENDKRVAVGRMRQEGAIITTVESILFELCRFAGNDTFKAISKLIK